MRFDGDIVITDPCYLIKDRDAVNNCRDDDWDLCLYGDDMGALGFETFVVEETGVGDWSCKVFNTDTDEEVGEFCADAGLVGVFLLSEIQKYNPHFVTWAQTHPWCATVIYDFHGDAGVEWADEDYVHVYGRGNVNFCSMLA